MYYSTQYSSPVGVMTLACHADKLVGLWIEGQKYFGCSVSQKMFAKDDIAVFDATKKWLDRYFAKAKPLITELPLAPSGSAFRQAVWQILCGIPYGQSLSYGDIAKKLNKNSAQAVGGAVGHNPISIIIPCHRVLGKDGSLTGYAGGLDVKAKLLELEGFTTSVSL
ncbi:MAG: methylated-DNA--[protein]-cysteine S-methyltransferase [Deferribacteraceae bacterium]|jgi:methylated-DNA-[protein]-cysteine S-methyltransferase|nr:methylated-DNA--[protein]-cysteine S-methyltransferase [Deferribacteraceae bacterium]